MNGPAGPTLNRGHARSCAAEVIKVETWRLNCPEILRRIQETLVALDRTRFVLDGLHHILKVDRRLADSK